jgi:hypothetical protein
VQLAVLKLCQRYFIRFRTAIRKSAAANMTSGSPSSEQRCYLHLTDTCLLTVMTTTRFWPTLLFHTLLLKDLHTIVTCSMILVTSSRSSQRFLTLHFAKWLCGARIPATPAV